MRKPIRVKAEYFVEENRDVYLAFCDDGSMWVMYRESEVMGWERLPDIPQDEPEQPVTSNEVAKALRYLEKCEREYREMHDALGSGHIRTGHAWDKMRRAGDAAREVLKRIDGQEEPR